MRIGLQTWGSDGDIRPFLALAAGLRAAGHEVTLIITSVDGKDYAGWSPRLGITVTQTEYPRLDAAGLNAFGKEILRVRHLGKHLALVIRHLIEPSDGIVEEAARELCAGHELVVGHSIVHALAAHAARRGCRYVSVQYHAGAVPTRHQPPPGAPNFGPLANRMLWRIAGHVLDRIMLARINAVRSRVGVPRVSSFLQDACASAEVDLIAASPCLVPPQPDWAPAHRVCGYFDLPPDAESALPQSVAAFVAAGDPPVYMTVGSMIGVEASAEDLTRTIVAAAQRAGCRAIVQSPEAVLAALPDHPQICKVSAAPHALLFPRCAAVVHHGGAGTSHAACRAGVPSIVVPYFLDQGAWARALTAAGVAPRPLPRPALSLQRLAARLTQALSDTGLRARARALGEQMRAEDGVAQAVAYIGEEQTPRGGFPVSRQARDCPLAAGGTSAQST